MSQKRSVIKSTPHVVTLIAVTANIATTLRGAKFTASMSQDGTGNETIKSTTGVATSFFETPRKTAINTAGKSPYQCWETFYTAAH
jgi:hypothetical protein